MSSTTSTPAASDGPAGRPGVRLGLLLAGLPAVAAASAFAAVLWIGAGRPLAGPYEGEAERRAKRGDFAGALVCYKRLLAIVPERVDLRYASAIALDRLGRGEQAEATARSIAPADRLGYPPAHYWLARRIMADRARLPGRAAAAEGHLLRFLSAFPNTAQARALLGSLYAGTGRPAEALPLLEATAGEEPERLLELARVRRDLGDRAEGLKLTRSAMEEARRRAEARPDDKLSRSLWARASADLGEFAEAIRALEKGKALSNDPVFDRQIGATCSSWEESLRRSGAKPGDRLAILQMGLRHDEGNPDLLKQLGSFLKGEGKEAEEARAGVRAALGSGRTPGLAHFLLGVDAWDRGRPDEARNHWELANRVDPRTPEVANNLAWLLAHREPTDLPRAKALIDRAIEQSPGEPALRGTRGQVLARMGRWKDAVTELEAALSGGAGSPALHADLASAYDHLGMPEMAAEHRKP